MRPKGGAEPFPIPEKLKRVGSVARYRKAQNLAAKTETWLCPYCGTEVTMEARHGASINCPGCIAAGRDNALLIRLGDD